MTEFEANILWAEEKLEEIRTNLPDWDELEWAEGEGMHNPWMFNCWELSKILPDLIAAAKEA